MDYWLDQQRAPGAVAVEHYENPSAGSNGTRVAHLGKSCDGLLHDTWALSVSFAALPGALFHPRTYRKPYALVTVPGCSVCLACCDPALGEVHLYYAVAKSDQLCQAQQKGARHLDLACVLCLWAVFHAY
jgi:hypothetical protein